MKLLFICHGNICRSPMAEYIMRDLLAKHKVQGVAVDSCATSTEELGNPVYPPAKRKLKEHGISCDGHAARQVTKADYANHDKLICMDGMNIRNLMRIIGSDPECKVCLLKDYTTGGSVADPWYTGDFETTYREILDGCTAILEELK
ncbi:MAG: low molecular weight phosphotyrosine protein phosphatase [Oscillospiraceae bacterium]|nr:low molecular weight phosphotyrosine protein phosphatase [Oscillospiraceae bacterium]